MNQNTNKITHEFVCPNNDKHQVELKASDEVIPYCVECNCQAILREIKECCCCE
jgi:hypothetical protein